MAGIVATARLCIVPVKQSRTADPSPSAIVAADVSLSPSKPAQSKAHGARREPPGLAQLSLVEHALCPLDANFSIRGSYLYESHYGYTDTAGKRQRANVRITYPNGLSANDELYLWGLIGLTFAQTQPTPQFYATPHYCLRQLGLIDQHGHRGGKDYKSFRTALRRLAAVTYFNTGFYDPIRGEHRDRSFGFLKYDLPLNADSSRAWRLVWDPLFFEFCQATGGRLFFDLVTYRRLDCATRRLFLFTHKIFWRSSVSPLLDVRYLTQHVMGFAEGISVRNLKMKLTRCIQKLLDLGLLAMPAEAARPQDLYRKKAKGSYAVQLHRGPQFGRSVAASSPASVIDSPHYDQLSAIGFDDPSIRRILTAYLSPLIAEWADITLAAKERRGEKFFSVSPQAYFMDNIKAAAAGRRTPPDWWRDLRVQEARARREAEGRTSGPDASAHERAYAAYLEHEARDAFERTMGRIFTDLRQAGVDESEARDKAVYIARMNLRKKFWKDHPEFAQ